MQWLCKILFTHLISYPKPWIKKSKTLCEFFFSQAQATQTFTVDSIWKWQLFLLLCCSITIANSEVYELPFKGRKWILIHIGTKSLSHMLKSYSSSTRLDSSEMQCKSTSSLSMVLQHHLHQHFFTFVFKF